MRSRCVALASLLCALASGPAATQGQPRDTKPAPAAFAAIKTAPADHRHLSASFTVHDPEDEGGEMPSTIDYFKKGSRDYGTFMSVTDLSLCRRPSERAICESFRKIIAAAPPVGADVTESRIGGSGYRTAYIARVDGVKLEGVDAAAAFLGGDNQDVPPASQLSLYIYARRGSNLMQLTTGVGSCTSAPRPKEKDDAYYRRACANDQVLARANAAGKRLVELFRLER